MQSRSSKEPIKRSEDAAIAEPDAWIVVFLFPIWPQGFRLPPKLPVLGFVSECRPKSPLQIGVEVHFDCAVMKPPESWRDEPEPP